MGSCTFWIWGRRFGDISPLTTTFAVNREPTDEQQTAWTYIMKVFKHVEATAKPGKNCQQLFHEAQAILDEAPVGVFNHHLGHGIGMFPHESAAFESALE